jgi:hypothetical protein
MLRMTRRRRMRVFAKLSEVKSAASIIDYASPQTKGEFRRIVTDFLLIGGLAFVVNVGFIALSIWELHRSTWVYQDLMHNRRGYGREIAPETIASLRHPYGVWISESLSALATGFGALLALHLITAARLLLSNPNESVHRFRQYRFWKPIGTFLTAAAFFWASTEDSGFWIAATRHVPVGSWPPILPTLLFVICGLVPVWWVHRSVLA